jgi:hypothetical protein
VGRRRRQRRAARPGRDTGSAGRGDVPWACALVSADTLDAALGAWCWTRAARAGGRLVIAIDGKAVRGATAKGGRAPHLVAALAHGIGAVLGQVAVEAKSNEIPAARELLKAFADLAGAVLTIDALHTQHDTAQAILGRKADYVMTVKANMPTLYMQFKELPWAQVPAVSAVSTGHWLLNDKGHVADGGDVASDLLLSVGVTGFEPATSSSRTKRATKLRHTPMPANQTLSGEPLLV